MVNGFFCIVSHETIQDFGSLHYLSVLSESFGHYVLETWPESVCSEDPNQTWLVVLEPLKKNITGSTFCQPSGSPQLLKTKADFKRYRLLDSALVST